ncbi:hypothetical protein Tco_0538675, partial [Tanacetum coccineum]
MFGSDTIKLDRMDRMNFTRWKEKMKFLLTAFKNLNGASSSKVNYVDSGKNNKGNDKKMKGHIKRYCKNPKKKNQNSNKKDESANAVEQVDTTKITAMVSEMNIEMIQELHMASVTTTDDW